MKLELKEFRSLVRSALEEMYYPGGMQFRMIDNDGEESLQTLQDLPFELELIRVGHQAEIDASKPAQTLRLHVRKVSEGRYRVKANVSGRMNNFGERSEHELVKIVRGMVLPFLAF